METFYNQKNCLFVIKLLKLLLCPVWTLHYKGSLTVEDNIVLSMSYFLYPIFDTDRPVY